MTLLSARLDISNRRRRRGAEFLGIHLFAQRHRAEQVMRRLRQRSLPGFAVSRSSPR